MLRKIGLTLLFTCTLFSAPTYSIVAPLQAGLTIEYDFNPNEPLTFVNYLLWEVEANCKFAVDNNNNEFLIEALAKKGKINDITLAKGESTRVMVHPNDNLKINAESGSKFRVTNLGHHSIKATCIS
jgi:hypothetical protein